MTKKKSTIISIFILFLALPVLAKEEKSNLLSLEKSIEVALENNRQIHAAQQALREVSAKVRETRTSFFPQLSSQSTYTRLEEVPSFEISGSSTEMGKKEVYDAKASLNQPLYTGGALLYTHRGARAEFSASQGKYDKVRQGLVYNVKEAYFSVLKAQKFVEVSMQEVENIEFHLKVVQDYYEVGLVPRNDLLTAQVELANAKQKLIEARNKLRLAKSSFNIFLGRDLEAEVRIIDVETFEPQKFALKECVVSAYQDRPELREAQANISSGKARIKLAQSGYKPSISLRGDYDWQKGTMDAPDEFEGAWTAMAIADINIWDWGKTHSQVLQAEAGLEALRDSQILLKDAISLEVKEAYLSLNEAQEKVEVMTKAIEQAQENLRIMEERYKVQAATTTDVMDAQTLLTNAMTSYFQALYDCHIAKAGLCKAMGRE